MDYPGRVLRTLSSYFLRTLREDLADTGVGSHKPLARAGYIQRATPGIYTWLPLGLRVLRKVKAIVREEMDRMGAREVHLPALLLVESYKAMKHWEEYGPTLFTLADRKQGDYLLAPVHKEVFILLVKDMYSSYRDLSMMLYQIQMKYHDEARPRVGLIYGREFIMKDAYSFNLTGKGLDVSYNAECNTYERISTRLRPDYVIVSAMSGAMGGSRSEEFLHLSPIGEDTFVRSPGGYMTNAEAVTTPAPESIDASGVGEPRVVATPKCPTIETLMELLNSEYPRSDGRPRNGTDTSKNAVVTLTHLDGVSELLIVGIPDDRQIDTKCLGASLAPVEVEMATDKEFEDHPELVHGYIGLQVIGPSSPARIIDEDGRVSGSARYLADPRIVEGTSWVTGANKNQHYALDLVMRRDLQADGTIEAAEVREGDLVPDSSGPLHLERGIEIGHIFVLSRKYVRAPGLAVLDRNGEAQVATTGSYGIGVSRAFAALVEVDHDDKGLVWPAIIAPFDVHVLATGKGNEVFETARTLSQELEIRGLDVLLDDRRKMSVGVKFADSGLLGIPLPSVVGREPVTGLVEVHECASGERRELTIKEAVEIFVATHEQLIKGE